MVQLPIYLDNHATTPVDPRVLEAMLPFFRNEFGNAASQSHAFGWRAMEAVGVARRQVARLLNLSEREIVFTSGATESNNLAIKGAATASGRPGGHIITCATEHKAVLDSCRALERQGYRVSVLPVDSEGRVTAADVESALSPDTVLCSIMAANNEIGTLQPIAEIGQLCRDRGVLFHSDAVQALGKMPLDLQQLPIDLLSITAHKMYGPKGVGALCVRRREPKIAIDPILDGGGHERGLRSGTLNVPGIVGLGVACQILAEEMTAENERILALRERLRTTIFAGLPDVKLNGSLEHRLPGNLNVSFAGVGGESLLLALRDVAVSTSSACTSDSPDPSHVLKAIGLSRAMAERTIRFGIGRFNSAEEVDYVAELVVSHVRQARALNPIYDIISPEAS